MLDGYLHDPHATAPVEFFHSALARRLHGTPLTLWTALERDPALHRRVADDGGPDPQAPPHDDRFVAAHLARLIAEGAECARCRFRELCAGYFKWPDSSYDCAPVVALLGQLGRGRQRARARPRGRGGGRAVSGRPLSLILLPTLDCNVACDYCFEEKARLSLSRDQLGKVTNAILDHMAAQGTTRAELYWQGGEVLLLGPAWFEHAHASMARAAAERGLSLPSLDPDESHRLRPALGSGPARDVRRFARDLDGLPERPPAAQERQHGALYRGVAPIGAPSARGGPRGGGHRRAPRGQPGSRARATSSPSTRRRPASTTCR